MAISERIAGTVFFKAGGTSFPPLPGWSASGFQPERDGIAGADGAVHGYKETAQTPTLEGDLSATAAYTVNDLEQAISGQTVMLETANGHVYTLRKAWLKSVETDSGEGKHSVSIQGMSGRVIK